MDTNKRIVLVGTGAESIPRMVELIGRVQPRTLPPAPKQVHNILKGGAVDLGESDIEGPIQTPSMTPSKAGRVWGRFHPSPLGGGRVPMSRAQRRIRR